MFRSMFVHAVVIGLLCLGPTKVQAGEEFRPTITVTGTAEIKVAPDEAVLSISVESREKELEKAFEDNDSKIREVIDLLKHSGIEPADIQTEVIEISPIFPEKRYAYQGKAALQQANVNQAVENPFGNGQSELPAQLILPVPVGYLAKRGLLVTIKQLDEFEKIYRELIKKGVNNVGGIRFKTSKLRQHRDKARLEAVRAAREKAVAMAGQLEARVAAIETVTEQDSHHFSGSQNYFGREGSFGGEQADSIAAGMIKITASVRVVFLLNEVEFGE